MSSKNLNTTEAKPAITAPNISKTAKELNREKLEAFMKEESRLVKGIFQCFESPGSTQRIQQKKYPGPEKGGIPAFDKTMTDGMQYEIPLWVARWLNGVDVTATAVDGKIGSCSYPVHGFTSVGGNLAPSSMGVGPNGEGGVPVPLIGIAKRVKRFGFQSLEFAL